MTFALRSRCCCGPYGSFSLKHLPSGKVSIEVFSQLAGRADDHVLGTFTQEVAIVEGERAYVHAVIKKP